MELLVPLLALVAAWLSDQRDEAEPEPEALFNDGLVCTPDDGSPSSSFDHPVVE